MSELKRIDFLAKTALNWQIWKETEPDLFWFLERNFSASEVDINLSDAHVIINAILPNDQIGRLEKSFNDGSLSIELDKIHGLDPVATGKRDARLSKLTITMAPARPVNVKTQHTIESLEQCLIGIEKLERARSIDIKVVMENLQAFQIEMAKRMESLQKRQVELEEKLEAKCEKLAKTMARYRN